MAVTTSSETVFSMLGSSQTHELKFLATRHAAQTFLNTFSKLRHQCVVDDWVADVVYVEEVESPLFVSESKHKVTDERSDQKLQKDGRVDHKCRHVHASGLVACIEFRLRPLFCAVIGFALVT